MNILDYPFLQIGSRTPPRPVLYLRIINPHTDLYIDVPGIIDTGADNCALPASLATLIGHNLQEGATREIITGNGTSVAYSHACRINVFDTIALLHKKQEFVYSLSDTPIDFMPNLHCVLLGVDNFLDRFILNVDYPRQVFSIHKP